MRKIALILTAALTFSSAFAQKTVPPTPAEVAAAAQPTSDNLWWKHAVVYEIYPRSFGDTNGDGIGDLNGITAHLDYLQNLGVTAIWIAPMYPSPQVDFGYDVANYEAVDPQYGTMANFDHLMKEAEKHHIRIMLDFVPNHTSDKHAWFLDSASSRTNPHADWYVWNDGKPTDDPKAPGAHKGPHGWVVPPNNWTSLFQGSAWEWVESRQQFYYHFFYKQQPDLNWRNPAVEKAMLDQMRFWLDKGVAGFRLDAIGTIYEDTSLRDEKLTGRLDASGYPETDHALSQGLPEVHDLMARMHTMVAAYPGNRALIGEIYTPETAVLKAWYGTPQHPELELPMDTLIGFHKEGGGITDDANPTLSAGHFRKYITEAEMELGAGNTPLFVFDNHDQPRSWDRFTTAGETYEQKQLIARIIATMLYTTRATALTYYGAELGVTTHTPTRREDVRDPIGITGWPKEKGRDGERLPMQWTAGPQAGFGTNPQTWLPVAPDYKTVNVATEQADPSSLLRWSQTLIAIRAKNPTMHDGGIVMLDNDNASVLSYVRTAPAGGHAIVISLNMTSQPQTVRLDLTPAGVKTSKVKTLLGDNASLTSISDVSNYTLPPYTSFVAEVQ